MTEDLLWPDYATPDDLATIEAHVRGQIAGYKAPRSIWLVGTISRGPAGKPDYGWAHRHVASHPAHPVA